MNDRIEVIEVVAPATGKITGYRGYKNGVDCGKWKTKKQAYNNTAKTGIKQVTV